eukprot:7672484-Prorocentrum_lima.AAC.1
MGALSPLSTILILILVPWLDFLPLVLGLFVAVVLALSLLLLLLLLSSGESIGSQEPLSNSPLALLRVGRPLSQPFRQRQHVLRLFSLASER